MTAPALPLVTLTDDLWSGPGKPPEDLRRVAVWTRNVLLRNGYRAVAQLTAATGQDLTDLRSFGEGCLAEVRRVLAAHGFHLAGEAP